MQGRKYTDSERIRILNNIIKEVRINDYNIYQICQKHSLAHKTFCEWLAFPHEPFPQLLDKYEKAKREQAPSTEDLLSAAKQGLVELLKGAYEITTDETYDLTKDATKPISRKVRKRKFVPNITAINDIISKLSDVLSYKQDTTNILAVFTSLNEHILSSRKYSDEFMHQLMQIQKDYFTNPQSITPLLDSTTPPDNVSDEDDDEDKTD